MKKIVVCLFVVVIAKEVVTQHTENNIDFVTTRSYLTTKSLTSIATTTNAPIQPNLKHEIVAVVEPNVIIKLYNRLISGIKAFFNSPKVITVFRNIGTCVVNGAMDIVTYYVPAPMIPLLATAAGLLIPFEPVVTLKRTMPVTSYRRAFNKAVNTFIGTFDKYKEIDNDDPYMTRRFNRRFMNDSTEKKKKQFKKSSEE